MGDDSDWLKLPTDDKCTHKAWKARIAGYEEAKKLFETQDDPKSPEFSRYLGLIKKFVTDSNAIAQEKALDTVIVFLENAAAAGKTAGEVCSGVVTKCLNSSRTRTREKGMEILMLYIEIEKQEIVQEELLKGLTNKQPKVVAACVQTLRESLRDFGSKVITLKPIVKQLQRLLEDRDKTVREEGKLLVVEIYHWIGVALRPQLSSLKPVQVSELEVEFEKLPGTKAQQTRFLRSQQDLKAKFEAQAAAKASGDGEGMDEEDGSGDAAVEIDPYEMMSAVEILSKLPKDFYDKVESAKWQERRESLDACLKLLEAPKLEQGDYHDLMKAIKKVVAKDKNVILVGLAVKCISGLATGLRKKFSSYAVLCVEVLLEKFKEKKPAIVAALREAVDAIFLTTSLDAISEPCIEALQHKTPSVKAEAASYLARCYAKSSTATLPKKLLKIFVTPLLKTVNDTTPEVREASFEALGTAMKVVGEKPLMPFLAELDNIKMGKIKECCEKAGVKGASSKAAEPSKKSVSAPAAAPSKGRPKVTRGDDSKPKAASGAPSGGAKVVKGGKKKAPASAGGKAKKSTSEEATETILGDETVEELVLAQLPADAVQNLSSSNWKERLAAMEKFTEVVAALDRKDICTQAFVRIITKKPGLKETNFQVLKLKVDLLATLGQKGTFTRTSASFCLNELVDKVGDIKNGAAVQEALSCIAEAISLNYIGTEVLNYAFEQRNPKNQAESLNWLAQAIKEFGLKIEPKPVIAAVKKALATSNPAVRGVGMNLLGVLFLYMGPQLRMFFENEKPALLLQIDAIFEKLANEKPPAPMRGISAVSQSEYDNDTEGGATGDGDDDEVDRDNFNVADLVPRTDISDKITEELLSDLKDKNWKIRNEALQKVVSILNDAKFITPNIGDLPVALHARLNDSNKNLIMQTLNICQTLATAMGPNIRNHTKTLACGVITCLGDSKPHVRKAALTALNVWVVQSSLLSFVEADILSEELRKENPFLRAELLGFLAEQLPNCKKLPPELDTCLLHLFTCLEDRNADVRKKAQEALLPFMVHLGFQKMMRKTSTLKASSKDQVMPLLEKTRDNLPQKAPAATTRPATTKSAPSHRPVSAVVDVDDDDRPSTAPARSTGTKGKTKAGGAAAAKKAPVASKKDKDEPDEGPPMKVSNGKEQRFKDEKNLKVLKWNFNCPRIEFVDQLHTQMEATFSAALLELLFHANFKMHIKAYDTLYKACTSHSAETIANLDLILKWLTLRFFDTNTSILLKGLEYIRELFTMLAADDYHLYDLEANSFIPYILNKIGDPKDNVRKDVRTILKLICKIYPASKMFSFVIDGLRSKNSKQRTECLEELGSLIEIYGITVCQPSPAQALKLIAQQIGDRDNSVRSAALNTIVAAYLILGEGVYKYIGNLSDKDQSMLEERIKRSMKNGAAVVPPSEEKAKVSKSAPNAKSASESRGRGGGGLKLQPNPTSDHRRQLLELSDGPSLKLEVEMPKLIEHDLQDLLYEPVKMPVRRSRPQSHNMKLLSNSDDAKSAIDLVLSQIASNDISTSIQALAQVDEVLKDNTKCQLLKTHIDQFLVVTSLQLRMAYSKYMSDSDTSDEVVIKLYRCLLGSLLELFQKKSLVKEGSKDVLKDLMQNLVTILLDARLNNLEDGPQLVRTINLFLVKVVEKANSTSVMSALIKLLHESVASETCSTTFLEIIMKCLWRMVRNLPGIIDDLDVDCILWDLHQFLVAFPSHTWRHRPSDVPLRTVKTILHSLAKLKGNKIMSHLSLVDAQQSEVESYLQKVIRSGIENSVSSTNAKNEQMNNVENGNVETRSPQKETAKSKRLSRTTHDMLAEIFKKIGSKENTREGLNDLYDFKLRYPEADLEPFLKKSSPIFQNYIQRGLKNIEAERALTATTATSSTTTGHMKTSLSAPTMPASASAESDECDPDMNYYMERLKVLRSRCGLDNAQTDRMPSAASAGDLGSATFSAAYYEDRLKALRARGGLDSIDMSAQTSGDGVDASSSNSSSSLSSESSSTAMVGTTISNSDRNVENTTAYVADLKKRLDRIKNSTRH